MQMFEELTNNLSQLTHFLPQMEPLAMRMEEIGYDLSDCAGDLGNYLDQMDYQPQELEQVEERWTCSTGSSANMATRSRKF